MNNTNETFIRVQYTDYSGKRVSGPRFVFTTREEAKRWSRLALNKNQRRTVRYSIES